MADLINVSRITNANIYMDGISLLGRAEEVELAFPKAKLVDHKGLGMFGTIETPVGIEKLEAKIKWISVYEQVMLGISIFQSHQFQIRASKETYTSAGRTSEVPFVGLMTAQFKDGGPLNFKQHENVDFPMTLVVYHVEYFVAGTQFLLYDSMSNQYVVNGVDQLSTFRSILGLL